jgi:hypothetical protein
MDQLMAFILLLILVLAIEWIFNALVWKGK